MLKVNRVLWIGACCALLVPSECLHAQLRGGAAADRPGLGGRIAARRDDRANRPPQPTPAIAATAAAAAARAAQLNAPLNSPRNNAAANNAAANPAANAASTLPRTNPMAQNPLANNPSRYPATNNPTASNRAGNPNALNAAAGDMRVSNYGAVNPNAMGLSPNLNAAGYGVGNLGYNNSVAPASASMPSNGNRGLSLPPNRLPYTGPGVLVRLPRELRGEVNYLIDDMEQMLVHSGEEQLLRLKGNYQVRFSRGVTSDGRSYGEARYTITEGIYRFDVADNGWELYREADGNELTRRLEELRRQPAPQPEFGGQSETALSSARSPFDSASLDTASASSAPAIAAPLAPSSASELRRPSTPALPSPFPPSPAPATRPQDSPAPAESAPAAAGSEETLPAPRSILEPT